MRDFSIRAGATAIPVVAPGRDQERALHHKPPPVRALLSYFLLGFSGMASNILYIEDNEFNQRLIRKVLEPLGFPITEALDGIQGIKKAVALKPNLILVDLDLPHLDGLGVAAKIKSVAGMEDVPVVALTSKRSPAERQRALAAGCDGCIEKPIDAQSFPQQIETYLNGKREASNTADQTRFLKDYNVSLIDNLQAKVEELEAANKALTENKAELEDAYAQSQKSNIELQKLNHMKEHIVAVTSHELRTPLSIASGYIDLHLEGILGELNEDQCRYLQISRQSLAKMDELIDKITDLTRLTHKKIPLNLEEMDLNQAFTQVYDDLAFFMKIRNLEFSQNLAPEGLAVLADRNLLHQVFSNLLKNAICFTPDLGKITVSSWCNRNKAYFEIKDTGVGLKKEDTKRVFDQFYQAGDANHHKTGHFEFLTRGIGVGLSLCKGIVTQLGGKIRAQSDGPDQGSTFTFYLPLVKKE